MIARPAHRPAERCPQSPIKPGLRKPPQSVNLVIFVPAWRKQHSAAKSGYKRASVAQVERANDSDKSFSNRRIRRLKKTRATTLSPTVLEGHDYVTLTQLKDM
jgi:hypothetical protein